MTKAGTASAGAAAPRDGRSTRWDPHRRRRRDAIIAAAIEAIEEHGPDALTAQIAERAGVPRTHVYRHFEGKQALDLAVSRHVAREIAGSIRAGLAVGGSALEIIGGAISQHLAWIALHPNLYRFLAQHAYTVRDTGTAAVDDAKAAFAGELTALLERYLRALDVDPSPAQRLIVGVVGMVDSTAVWWLDHRDPADPGTVSLETLTRDLTDQVWLVLSTAVRDLGIVLDPAAELPAPT